MTHPYTPAAWLRDEMSEWQKDALYFYACGIVTGIGLMLIVNYAPR